ncbi:MAG TPA: hypothetical protein DCQ84_00540 [Candidatus Competibacteraceae bacterium]|nr:hypothetical protein [Candidatus Competibacteraceae bacterium]
MPRIPDIELERLKAEVLVERLIEARGVVLKKRGADLVGLCPFHEDREPSLVVTPSKNLWHCFGCGLGGGAIDWVMKSEGVSFRHAVERLKEGLPIFAAVPVGATGEDRSQALPARPIKRSTVRTLDLPVRLDADDQALLNQVIDYYHATLKQSPEALSYLEQRGIGSLEAIETFKLGYADRTLGLRLPEKTRKAGAEVRGRLVKLGLYREIGPRALQRLAGRAGVRRGRSGGRSLRPQAPRRPAARHAPSTCICPARIAGCGMWPALAGQRGDRPVRGADRRPDFLGGRVSECHGQLWGEWLYRRASGRVPTPRYPAGADRV